MPASIAINPAQVQTVSVSNATGTITVTLATSLVHADVDQVAKTIRVTASNQSGTDTLHVIDASGASVDVPIRVAPNAGTIQPAATLMVTGSPVDPDWLLQRVAGLVRALTKINAGTQPAFGAPSPLPGSAYAQFSVPVTVAGGAQYLDVAGATDVTVRYLPLDPFALSLLFYDDDPEKLSATGVLFRGTVSASFPTRLYYYHDSTSDPHRLLILLTSTSQNPTRVQLIESPSGPNLDVMSVGHNASRNYLLYKPHNQGVVVDLPQNAPYTLRDVIVGGRQGVAGAIDVRVLSGGPVMATVLSAPLDADDAAIAAMQNQPQLPDDGHRRTGIFDLTGYGQYFLNYAVGGPDATLMYGDQQPTPRNVEQDANGRDVGDYGVLQTIAFTLVNATDQPATAYLYERPIGGVVRSSFLIDGKLVEVGCIRISTQRYQIGDAFQLGPRQTYRLNVQTMTDGGSNYPVEIGIATTPPQPAAPPIGAPDGCFPKPLPSPSPAPTPV
jgi:hypothetical protein